MLNKLYIRRLNSQNERVKSTQCSSNRLDGWQHWHRLEKSQCNHRRVATISSFNSDLPCDERSRDWSDHVMFYSEDYSSSIGSGIDSVWNQVCKRVPIYRILSYEITGTLFSFDTPLNISVTSMTVAHPLLNQVRWPWQSLLQRVHAFCVWI